MRIPAKNVIQMPSKKPFRDLNTEERMRKSLIGQDQAIDRVLPYVKLHQAGLAPVNRPIGVFLLLGPTGTGKTKTVEALADALHGSERSMIKIDCGEFQMEHEVAKLIGAPPGYLGHRETQPIITQQKLNSVTSESSNLSIVLLDEIEKAAPSVQRMLLGVFDKATLRLGDNTTVNFERSMIFMTSNLGAVELQKAIALPFGLASGTVPPLGEFGGLNIAEVERLGKSAAGRKFTPEFNNRIDEVIGYVPLNHTMMQNILEIELCKLQQHIAERLEEEAFEIEVTESGCAWLLKEGVSAKYGARELKRVISRNITQPLSVMVLNDELEPGNVVTAYEENGKLALSVRDE